MIWERSKVILFRYPRTASIISAVLGGTLYALSNIGYGVWPLAFIAIIPLWFALDSLASKQFACAFFIGLLFGLSIFLTGFPWLLNLSQEFLEASSFLSYLLWLAIGIWFAASFALYSLGYLFLRSQGIAPWLAGMAPFIIMEWTQLNLFPSYLGAALINQPSLAQIADLGGPLILTAFILAVNVFIYRLLNCLNASNEKRPYGLASTVSACICLFCVVWLYGLASAYVFEDKKNGVSPLKVGSVQTNLVKLPRDELSLRSHKVHLEQSEALLSEEAIDLLIWPETAYVRGIRRPLPLDARFIRQNIDVPIIFGGTSVWQHGGKKVHANSVFIADRAGVIEQVYDKNLLIPFAEYLPYQNIFEPHSDKLQGLFPHGQMFRAGEHQKALELGEWKIQTPICFEVIHHDFIRQSVEASNPHMIITLANDAWFGDSQEPWIHLSLARLRAIENRLWMVRATNSGISAVIDPLGNIIAQTGLNTKENMVANVYPVQSRSLFTLLGDWVGWLALILLSLALLKTRERRMVVNPSSF